MTSHDQTPQELRLEIDATLRELGATIEQLAAKTAVKARLRGRLEDVKDDLKRNLGLPQARVVAIGSVGIVLVAGWALSRRTH